MTVKERVAIIGAGPKALAIAAKNQVLSELGFAVPEIHIFEKRAVAAHWQGNHGFTNGDLELGTSPLKDIGFPYATKLDDQSLAHEINTKMQRYGYLAFLVASGGYADWIDRGLPMLTHKMWAQYLLWVYEQIKGSIKFYKAKVNAASIQDNCWQIQFTQSGISMSAPFNSLVLTGPGMLKNNIACHVEQGIYSADNYWQCIDLLMKKPKVKIAIVGAGENAASMVLSLLELKHPNLFVDIICPQGAAFSRCESYSENRYYSDPERHHWKALSPLMKKSFIRRTDVGVISQQGMASLNTALNVSYLTGKVRKKPIFIKDKLEVEILQTYGKEIRTYDYLVFATGFSQSLYLKNLLDKNTQKEVMRQANLVEISHARLSEKINHTLALDGLTPSLYLPMLAAENQGPGFPNLSCLGRLSDRILTQYLKMEKHNLERETICQLAVS